ncbi:N-acetylglucosamine-6-phosphate deacetylase [Acholeplasma hippikon]|uniref:N-acetylglucosamine-6-phosphate deacetylase n=1 Tax=Acholeplasma hippikon TaxID=264636 RepID=A0A449BJR3_9MOLU|nr:N-acetylglucosamine-6-phosphate deacetylase [Acholeplasma hippikon]VEU82704.1 N-acetylglucosamine-6-phosphate deacetylase [Acholeplasma hippikon]
MLIKNVNIVLADKEVFGDVSVKDGKIAEIIKKERPQNNDANYLVPGFIDVHIHGSNNYDAMDADSAAIEKMALSLVKEGTTGFLPTTMTQTIQNVENALEAIAVYHKNQNPMATEVYGVHLEGPFINEGAAGAQPKNCIIKPTIEVFEAFNKKANNLIKKVSLAPEIEGSIELIKYLKANQIVASVAHTKANYATVKAGMEAGLTSLTHFYNAMTPLHHRDIGVVGAGLLHNEMNAELIFDEIHVSVAAAKVLLQAKGVNNVTLITDSMRAKYMPEGESELGGQTVYIKNNEARLFDGTLAGSILKMNDGYRNLVKDLNLSVVEASIMASVNPAKQLNLFNEVGSIEVGKKANLVILDKNFNVVETIIKGQSVYKA